MGHDLEHLYRNCKKNIAEHPLSRDVAIWLRMCHTVAYLYNKLFASLMLKSYLRRASEGWGGESFADYFKKTYLQEKQFNNETYLVAPFFSGHLSGLVAGYPATQQFSEELFADLKNDSLVRNQCNDVVSMLLAVEKVCKQKICTAGYAHSLIGPGQVLRGVRPMPHELSADLLTGPGRAVK
eukprot:297734-Karenia_brevis.AAC.1